MEDEQESKVFCFVASAVEGIDCVIQIKRFFSYFQLVTLLLEPNVSFQNFILMTCVADSFCVANFPLLSTAG